MITAISICVIVLFLLLLISMLVYVYDVCCVTVYSCVRCLVVFSDCDDGVLVVVLFVFICILLSFFIIIIMYLHVLLCVICILFFVIEPGRLVNYLGSGRIGHGSGGSVVHSLACKTPSRPLMDIVLGQSSPDWHPLFIVHCYAYALFVIILAFTYVCYRALILF